MIDIFDLRRDFTLMTLDEQDVDVNPIYQFERWLNQAMKANALEPNAMNLSTVGLDMKPSSRIVLLKKVTSKGFIFFSNYESRKASQIKENPNVSLTFIWHELERQIRIEGIATKISEKESDSYFETRPTASKLGAWASPQSQIIPNRLYLEELVFNFEKKFNGKNINRPKSWGGYIIKPELMEFWQGRESRLHDRIQYKWVENKWLITRLAP